MCQDKGKCQMKFKASVLGIPISVQTRDQISGWCDLYIHASVWKSRLLKLIACCSWKLIITSLTFTVLTFCSLPCYVLCSVKIVLDSVKKVALWASGFLHWQEAHSTFDFKQLIQILLCFLYDTNSSLNINICLWKHAYGPWSFSKLRPYSSPLALCRMTGSFGAIIVSASANQIFCLYLYWGGINKLEVEHTILQPSSPIK